MPEEFCPICEGAGLRVLERADGTRVAQPCVCRARRRSARMIEQARIPPRYAHCTLDNYDTKFQSSNQTLETALVQARNFVAEYPLGTDGSGLLLTGPNGTGKTHLAIGIAHGLIEKGCQCLFVTYGELLKQVQNTYNATVQQTELDILRPIFNAEVLILDELGSSKPTDWVWDTVAHILNTRYNDMRSTIITTNFVNSRELLDGDIPTEPAASRDSWLAMYKETLGDRIGERMRSRLQEMCTVIEVTGGDFRTKVKRHAHVKLNSAQKLPAISVPSPGAVSDSKREDERPVLGGARLGSRAARHDVSGSD